MLPEHVTVRVKGTARFRWRLRSQRKSKYWHRAVQVDVKVTTRCPAWTARWLSEWSEWSSDHRTWQYSNKAYLNPLGIETFVTCDTLCSTFCDTFVWPLFCPCRSDIQWLSCMLDSSLQRGYLLACNTPRKQCKRAARGQSEGKTWETMRNCRRTIRSHVPYLDWELHLPNLCDGSPTGCKLETTRRVVNKKTEKKQE